MASEISGLNPCFSSGLVPRKVCRMQSLHKQYTALANWEYLLPILMAQ